MKLAPNTHIIEAKNTAETDGQNLSKRFKNKIKTYLAT